MAVIAQSAQLDTPARERMAPRTAPDGSRHAWRGIMLRHDLLLVRLAEKAAIDLSLTILKIDTIDRAVQICGFAVFSRRNAKGAGEIPDLLQHLVNLSRLTSRDRR
jgi:hypothetical protein